jgi:hypothetical protein
VKLPLAAMLALIALGASGSEAPAATVLAHNVYFELKEDTPARRAELLAACRKYLTGYPGVVSFAVGTVADEMARPVNDRGWDVSLHVHFKDKASHDAYQEAPRHHEFITRQQGNWAKVRVFDSWIEAGP